MNPGEISVIESKRQALLAELRAAETALRASLHTTGFGNAAREHLERAMAHIQEAYVAINEAKAVRTVPQLVDDLVRLQQMTSEFRSRQCQHI